jgi:hypothetical protein
MVAPVRATGAGGSVGRDDRRGVSTRHLRRPFSGGYVTVLTAVYVVFLRLSFLEAVAITKLIDIFSSGIATAIFMWRHLSVFCRASGSRLCYTTVLAKAASSPSCAPSTAPPSSI